MAIWVVKELTLKVKRMFLKKQLESNSTFSAGASFSVKADDTIQIWLVVLAKHQTLKDQV